MTHQENCNLSSSVIEERARNGSKALPDMIRVILNSVMQAERSKYLQANAYELTEERREHANDYKPKKVRTEHAEITFILPQVLVWTFYPFAMEKA
jgi:transposase-like protein